MARKNNKPVEHAGAFSGGQLQIVVNAGRAAQKRLDWDKELSDEEKKQLYRDVSEGLSAEALIKDMRKARGFPESSSPPK